MNDTYYEKEFENIQDGLGTSFNWAAFFGGMAWMAYRKMYKYAILNFITCFFLSCCATVFISLYGEQYPYYMFHCLFFFSLLTIGIVQGMFANQWYYRTVQQKILAGYHLITNFSPITPFGMFFSFFWAFAANYFENKELKEYLQDQKLNEEDTRFNKENIKKYLKDSQVLTSELKWGIAFFCICVPFGHVSSVINNFLAQKTATIVKSEIDKNMQAITDRLNEENQNKN